MSSSNSSGGGGPPSSRYNNDYLDYGKQRRKNFYSSNLTSSTSPTTSSTNLNSNTHISSNTDSNSIPTTSRNGSYSSSSHYSNYGNYHDYYSGHGRNDTWRKSSSGAGDSRLTASNSSNAPGSGPGPGSGSSSSSSSSSYQQYRPNGDYRIKDRYDSYTGHDGSINTSKWKMSRSSVGSRYSAKDRMRGKQSSFTSGSNSIPLGSSSLVNSTNYRSTSGGGSGGDSYYGSGRSNGYSSSMNSMYSNPKAVDRYSSLSKNGGYSKPRDYKYRYVNKDYNRSTLITPVDKELKKEYEDRESPTPRDEDEEEEEEDEEEAEEEQEETNDKIKPETKPIEQLNESVEKPTLEVTVGYKPTPEMIEKATLEAATQLCRYPLTKIEYEFEELKKKFTQETKHHESGANYLKYSLARPILIESFQKKHNVINKKKKSLWKDYKQGLEVWETEQLKMDQQLRVLHPPNDEMRREIDSRDNIHFSTRRNRRHGDLVTTEAEFQEILLSLGQEDDENPLVKAERVAAKIPDMILDPVKRDKVLFMDSNNIVRDKNEWAQRVKHDFMNNFSEREHELFCEGFCLHPKRFGAIARHMGGLRSASECVVHYYMTKKKVNYKELLIKSRKKSKPRRKQKAAASKKEAVPVSTTVESGETEIELPPSSIVPVEQLVSEELYTETGRRKRAAAPVFDGKEKEKEKKKQRKDGTNIVVVNEPTSVNTAGGTAIATATTTTNTTTANTTTTTTTPTIDNTPTATTVITTPNLAPNVNPALAHVNNTNIINDSNSAVTMNIPVAGSAVSSSEIPVPTTTTEENKDNKRKVISSYWSITEANAFPKLLEEFGMNWGLISDKLATKSTTMVRNYFQRNAEKNGWDAIVANQKSSKMSIMSLLN
ncbi:Myb-like DNA-binding domain family protein [Candida albicans]|uniref:Myb-like DNA-binding domain family protein n=1 Tax=Candida albicans TaxID=5476 RepID=A0A8H6BWY0_CANAX|nr:Myb-like DNA-binding domain family protein [Candida albicans]